MKNIITLDGGLRIVHKYNPHVRSVAAGVFIGAGSRAENPKNSGISHFIEHMCFKGTSRRSAFQIVEEIDSLGAQINAFTSKEATAYYIYCIDEYVEKCLEILSDILLNHTFAEEDMDKERGVILEEIAMVKDSPDDLSQELASKAYWGANSLGMPILGSAKNVKSFTQEDLFAYERTHYVSENAVIAVVGNVEEKRLIELVGRYFPIKKGAADSSYRNTVNKHLGVKQCVKSIEQANLSLVYPSIKAAGVAEPALNILNSVYGSGMSSILFQTLREDMGLAYSVYSYPSAYMDSAMFGVYLGTNPGSLERAVSAIVDINKRLLDKGLTEEEFNRGKQQIKGAYILGQENAMSLMRALARSALADNEYFDIDKRIKLLNDVTNKDVFELIIKIFSAKPAVGYVGKKLGFDLGKAV